MSGEQQKEQEKAQEIGSEQQGEQGIAQKNDVNNMNNKR